MPIWFPLYLLLVAAATLSPLAVSCVPQAWGRLPGTPDFILNVLGFLPFGFAMARAGRSAARAVAMAALFSAALELSQRWMFRIPSAWDVFANALGAAIGWAVAVALVRTALGPEGTITRLVARRLAEPRVMTPVAAALALLAFAAVVEPARRDAAHDFSTWVLEPLVIGPEEYGELPWPGTVREFAIYDRVLDVRNAPPLRQAWSSGGPILHVSLERTPLARLDGPGGPRVIPVAPPAGIALGPEGLIGSPLPWRLPDEMARHLLDRARATNELTIVARVQATARPEGPARLVSLSSGYQRRDFSIHLARDSVRLLLRTRIVGPNGAPSAWPALVAGAPVPAGEFTLIAAADRYRARVGWHEACRGDIALAFRGLSSRVGAYLTLSVAICAALAALTVGSLLLGTGNRARAAAAIAAALATWTALALVGAFDHVTPAERWRHLLPAIAAGAAVLPLLDRIELLRRSKVRDAPTA